MSNWQVPWRNIYVHFDLLCKMKRKNSMQKFMNILSFLFLNTKSGLKFNPAYKNLFS